MQIDQPLALLGGLTPSQFMKRHWQRKPLLVRGAVPGMRSMVARERLFELAGQDEVESRLVVQEGGGKWKMRRGPFKRSAIPPNKRPGWTLLVQGMDLHDEGVHGLMQQFRFVPEARLDDLMISHATDGGGVGPHFDSYDVFLLQAHGRRRWRIGRQEDFTLQENVPLKILANFTPEEEYVLEPGDMLYLPPRYAHDGIAEGECMTWSVGFRAPRQDELAQELLARLADQASDELPDTMYQDAGQAATPQPARMPVALQQFAQAAVRALAQQPQRIDQALGEYLTEPKPMVWFDVPAKPLRLGPRHGVRLDRRSQMLYDRTHIYLNGESWRAGGSDARWMRQLADQRELTGADMQQVSSAVKDLLQDWLDAGWLHRV